jgi:hypothetical protein
MGQLNDAGTSATDWKSTNATRTLGVFNYGGGNGFQGNANGSNAAVWGNNDGSGFGVYGSNTTTNTHGSLGGTNGVEGVGASGVVGTATDSAGAGVEGQIGSGSFGVSGSGGAYTGVQGDGDTYGVVGLTGGTSGVGVFGQAVTSQGTGVQGEGGPYGVHGTGDTVGVKGEGGGYGVYGTSNLGGSVGVYGTSIEVGVAGQAVAGSGGIGVQARAPTSKEVALDVLGMAIFSRSGIATVNGTTAAPKNQVVVRNVMLTANSLVLAVVQGAGSIGVVSVSLNIASSNFTIHLAQAVTITVKVGWFIVN